MFRLSRTTCVPMSHLLVIGASGGIGLATVRRALSGGHHVRAFARSAASIAVDDARLEKFPGDALSHADTERALAGMDVVIQCLGVPAGAEMVRRGTTLFSRATRCLVDAMTVLGPKRLITVTGLGAGDSRGHGGLLYDKLLFPLILKRVYDDKDVQEMIIRRSGLDWTIARPGILTNAPATGVYHVLAEPATWRGGSIARADVADFLVREAEGGQYRGKTPVLIT